MLILARKPQQTIVVTPEMLLGADGSLGAGQIVITILNTTAGGCRIGIEAPRSARVLRGELANNES